MRQWWDSNLSFSIWPFFLFLVFVPASRVRAEDASGSGRDFRQWNSLNATTVNFKMRLDVEIGAHVILEIGSRAKVEEILHRRISLAQRCIRQAVEDKGGLVPFNLAIAINSISWLTPEDEAIRSYSAFLPDKDREGNAIRQNSGAESTTFNLIIFGVNVSHVPHRFSHEWRRLIGLPEFIPIHQFEEARHQLNLALQSESTDKQIIEKLANQANQLASKVSKAWERSARSLSAKRNSGEEMSIETLSEMLFDPSNVIKLREEFILFSDDFYESSLLAHEFLHSFGGLRDEYDDQENKEPNIMGSYLGSRECALRPDQIEHIFKYRGISLSSP